MGWSEMNKERDGNGELTDLALALEGLEGLGCDCGTDESGSCVGCLCEAALKSQWSRIAELEAEVKVAEERGAREFAKWLDGREVFEEVFVDTVDAVDQWLAARKGE